MSLQNRHFPKQHSYVIDRDQLEQSPSFYTFMESINSARIWSLAGRYDNPIPTWLLAHPKDCLTHEQSV